jgi:hypothetical protein
MNVSVVIPCYKEDLSEYEKISLRQCTKVLREHQKILVHPQSVNGKRVADIYKLDSHEAFQNDCFSSYINYNRTIKSAFFYERFLDYDYILLHQLDSFVFSDLLLHWCAQGYDYIGAPLGRIPRSAQEYCEKNYFPWWVRHLSYFWGVESLNYQLFNGGLSLRKTKTLYSIAAFWKKKISLWGKNEDLFWSVVAPALWPWFHLPQIDHAAKFALMVDVPDWIKAREGQLPFGCRGWPRYEFEAWKPYISSLGYRL